MVRDEPTEAEKVFAATPLPLEGLMTVFPTGVNPSYHCQEIFPDAPVMDMPKDWDGNPEQ